MTPQQYAYPRPYRCGLLSIFSCPWVLTGHTFVHSSLAVGHVPLLHFLMLVQTWGCMDKTLPDLCVGAGDRIWACVGLILVPDPNQHQHGSLSVSHALYCKQYMRWIKGLGTRLVWGAKDLLRNSSSWTSILPPSPVSGHWCYDQGEEILQTSTTTGKWE